MPGRPKRGHEPPPPAYIVDPNAKYCHTCARLIGVRKIRNAKASASDVKYCSDQCKNHKPDKSVDGQDAEIDDVLRSLLLDQHPSLSRLGVRKGDSRRLVPMSELEAAMLRRRLSKCSTVQVDSKGSHVATSKSDETSTDPTQSNMEDENWNESGEEDSGQTDQQRGQAQANHRKVIRNAARRAIIFGLALPISEVDGDSKHPEVRKCEAVVNGRVVEPSYAKGNWCIRWRAENQPASPG